MESTWARGTLSDGYGLCFLQVGNLFYPFGGNLTNHFIIVSPIKFVFPTRLTKERESLADMYKMGIVSVAYNLS
jgi:hypothetical protein